MWKHARREKGRAECPVGSLGVFRRGQALAGARKIRLRLDCARFGRSAGGGWSANSPNGAEEGLALTIHVRSGLTLHVDPVTGIPEEKDAFAAAGR